MTVLWDLKRRGLQAPVAAVGDGALGFWAVVRNVWPEAREQRDWCHKMARRLYAKAKRALREIMCAETRERAEEQVDCFAREYDAKYPKAVACLVEDRETLLTHFAFPAEHWFHLRTTNPIESPFATVRPHQRVTNGGGSRTKSLTMAFKLLDMTEKRWHRLNRTHFRSCAPAFSSSMDYASIGTTIKIGRRLSDDAGRSTTFDNT